MATEPVKMKIAVYAIALNEEQFVQRWYDSAKDADLLVIADTGSTDKTVELAESLGIKVVHINITPWRFDDARNASMAAIPKDFDYCIALDMDEVFVEGWRKEMEKTTPGITRPRYQYTWNWNEDGSPGLVYGGDKIHARKGYRWTHPVHEVMRKYNEGDETQEWIGLEIHHYPDNTKSRGQYFPLLEMSVREDPLDDRNAFYYARELFFHGRNEEAANEFKRHLALPRAVWAPERAASMRYLAKIETDKTEFWSIRAIEQAPGRREPHVDLAKYYYGISDWAKCYASATAALEIKEKPLEYLCEEESWGYVPHDMAAIAAYHLGKFDEAIEHGSQAVELCPASEKTRLSSNLSFYASARA
jgi:glycosyltransferase involved in cell wall biosynthesis